VVELLETFVNSDEGKGEDGNKMGDDKIENGYQEDHYPEIDPSSLEDYSRYEVADVGSEYNEFKDFTSLRAWKDARQVRLFFYQEILEKLPRVENYNLAEQIRRAAVSVTANLAEGYGRYNYPDAIHFYRIARGSLFELKDHLIACNDLGYIQKSLYAQGEKLIEQAKRSLNGFIKYNQSRLRQKHNQNA